MKRKSKKFGKYPTKKYQISYKRKFNSTEVPYNIKQRYKKKRAVKTNLLLRYLKGLGATTCAPIRYRFVSGNRLSEFGLRVSKSTRAAIVDTVTKTSTIRFDNPHVGHHTYSHINVLTKGTKLRDPHWKVPNGVVSAAEGTSKVLRYVGKAALIAGVVIDSARIVMAVRRDYKENKNNEKKLPKNTIKTVSSVGGGWAGGAAGAIGGSYAGTSICAAIGAVFGGVGAIPGAAIGGIIGAITEGIGGGIGGSVAAESIANKCLEDSDDENWEDLN